MTSAFAGVPTGRINAYEQDNVIGIRKRSGFWPKRAAISPEIGRKMVAMAELEASSVVKEAIMLMITTMSGTGNWCRAPS